jgi:hypothetical protein
MLSPSLSLFLSLSPSSFLSRYYKRNDESSLVFGCRPTNILNPETAVSLPAPHPHMTSHFLQYTALSFVIYLTRLFQ